MFKFEINETVMIDSLLCIVLEREVAEGELDYLCLPIDSTKMILGQTELGCGWVLERNIKSVLT